MVLHGPNLYGHTLAGLSLEETATAMVQSGVPCEWWDCAMECYCYFRNVRDKIGKTACEKRCSVRFDGFLIPFGKAASIFHKDASPESPRDTCCVREEDGRADLLLASEDFENTE